MFIALVVAATIAVVLLSGTVASNLSILILGNTEGAYFFFFLGCLLGLVIAMFMIVVILPSGKQKWDKRSKT